MKTIEQYIAEIIDEKDKLLFFEFGMYDAYHTYIMLDMIPSDKKFEYHGFEMIDWLYDQIVNKQKTYANGQMHLVNKAISDKTGVKKFYKSGGKRDENGQLKEHYYGSSSIVKPVEVTNVFPAMNFTDSQVECIKLDDYVNESGLTGKVIDFIWADIQGAEHLLIKGGVNTFKNVRYFYTEYCGKEWYKGNKDAKGIQRMLPYFEVVQDFGGDVLLKNKNL
jgi:FkbM family methyltransferase